MTARMTAWVLTVVGSAASSFAQTPLGTAFTYQGRLVDGGSPATGSYDFQLVLFDAASGGSPVGPMLAKDDVLVAEGLFTVALDFGAVFDGSQRWLEVGVRPGASGGAYTILTPRQELTPAPGALFSATAPWTGITGKPPGFADDIDNDSGGTVTSVATGAGLTGGPITGTGTVSVAPGGIASAMIANGAVGLAQINPAQVQARVSGTCPLGQYLRGINPDGTVLCEPFFAPNGITTVDDVANVGGFQSIAIGTDGLPVISYGDQTAGVTLKVAHCGDPACIGATLTTVDPAGSSSSIAIGADGLPVISYITAGAALKVAHCGNLDCTSANTLTIVDDPFNSIGGPTSIAIGTDGFPVISYRDQTAGALKVAHCVNAACSAGSALTTVDDPANDVGSSNSIAIGADGLPVVSYYDQTAGALKVAHCGNAACTAGNALTTVDDPANEVGLSNSIAIGTDGLPVVSHFDLTAGTLQVVHCGNAACTAGNSFVTVDSVGGSTSIAIGTDGLPVISYQDVTAHALKVAHCGNAACAAGNSLTTVDNPANFVGSSSSIAIGADGLPVISYIDLIAAALKVAKCATRSCQ